MFLYVKHILLILKREQPRNTDTVMVINNTWINYTHSNFVQATSLQYEAEIPHFTEANLVTCLEHKLTIIPICSNNGTSK